MDLTALQIFKSVVEHGGVNKAAARLHRVPSNVTTRIKQLEEQLGAQLFLRIGRRLALSAEGKLLLPLADQLLRLSSEAEAALRNKSREEPCGSGRWKVLRRAGCRWSSRDTTSSIRRSRSSSSRHFGRLGFRVHKQDVEAAFVAEPFNADDLGTQTVSWKSWFSSHRGASARCVPRRTSEIEPSSRFRPAARIGNGSRLGSAQRGPA